MEKVHRKENQEEERSIIDMFLFYYKSIKTGGAELLIEKLSKELRRRNESVHIACEDISDSMQKRFEQFNIPVVTNCSLYSNNNFLNVFLDKYEAGIKIVCFQLFDYCTLTHYARKQDKILLYIMHYDSLLIGVKGKLGILKRFWKHFIPGIIQELNSTNALVFMDETCVENTKRFFNNDDLNKSSFKIVRLPIDIVEITEQDLKNKAQINGLRILSIARADFPFKGYLIGLVGFFVQMDYNAELHIVSYGKDELILQQKIDSLNEDLKKRIHLYGETNFEDLEDLFKNSNVYIGMGTTLLDSTQRGIISIPVKADTYELYAENYFFTDWKKLVLDTEAGVNKIEALISDIANMSCDDYYKKSEAGRSSVIKNHSTSSIVDQITSTFEKLAYKRNFKSEIVWFIQIVKHKIFNIER